MLRLLQWMALGLLISAPGLGAAGAKSPKLEDIVPKRLQLSLASDHIFVATHLHVRPSDLGEPSWSSWDTDASGALSGSEVQALIGEVRRTNLPSQRLAIGRQLVDWAALPATRASAPGASLGLQEALNVRVSGKVARQTGSGRAHFVVYAPPRRANGIVPLRITVGAGTRLRDVAGARAEQRGPRRVEAVLSRFTPALWGRLEPEVDPKSPR